MRIVITGATGLIGRALARRLVHAGHHVVALSRDPAAAAQGTTRARVVDDLDKLDREIVRVCDTAALRR